MATTGASHSPTGTSLPRDRDKEFGEEFQFPPDFFRSVAAPHERLTKQRFTQLRSELSLRRRMQRANIAGDAFECLDGELNYEHFLHASNENRRGVPVETPHNNTHVALGYPLTDLGTAAFHPMFWLLHCNVDRLYESYLQATPSRAAECLAEMEQHQQLMEIRGRTNLTQQPLTPFKTVDGQDYYCRDMFSARKLGYVYDRLAAPPAPKLRVRPNYVLFRNVDVVRHLMDRDGRLKSFTLHVFTVPHSAAEEVAKQDFTSTVDAYEDSLYYAGIVSAFAGKGPKCKNCAETEPVTLKLDVSSKLSALGGLKRGDVVIKVWCEDELGQICALDQLSDTYGPDCHIAAPKLVGPIFEDVNSSVARADETVDGDALNLQRYLAHFGFYPKDAALDGKFGPRTEQALKEFQASTALLSDGILGSVTKALIASPLNDSGVIAAAAGSGTATVEKGTSLKVFIGPSPSYLVRASYEETVCACLRQWIDGTSLSYEVTQNEAESNMKFLFGLPAAAAAAAVGEEGEDEDVADILQFDGPGGELARAEAGVVMFDHLEKWQLTAAECVRDLQFCLPAVCLHEIGHALGLPHSSDPDSVMFPYYEKDALELHESDRKKFNDMYA
mmetsp:Transcript_8295/g.13754  ORF Transcript_8295/g.13754 Transcript_8295/m.13754 type:complete len:616 (+) Transcript_8295:1037-2884(+)